MPWNLALSDLTLWCRCATRLLQKWGPYADWAMGGQCARGFNAECREGDGRGTMESGMDGRSGAVKAKWWMSAVLAASLAGCGGGGGDTPSLVGASGCLPGLITGFSGTIGDSPLGPFAPVPGLSTGEGGDGGAGGGVGGGGGEGVGGSDGQYTRVDVTVETAAGARTGPWPVDAASGMVTYVPCDHKPPMRITFQGRAADSVYYDEGTGRDESFAGKVRYGLITTPERNHGVTPFSHALYLRVQQIGRERGLTEGWHDLSVIEQAHREMLTAVNDQLPGIYRLDDLTRLPVMLNSRNDVEGSGVLTPNANGVYGAVVSGLSLMASTTLPRTGGTALELSDALASDLADGRLDLSAADGSAIATATRAPYSFESMWSHLTVGAGVTAARTGVDRLKDEAVPIGYVRAKAPEGATTTGARETLYALSSNGSLIAVPNPDAGTAPGKPAANQRFSQLYRFGPETVVALRRDGQGLMVFPTAWDGQFNVEVAAPAGGRIVEMFDVGYPVLRMADGSLFRLQGTSLVSEPAPPGMLNASCRSEYAGALANGSDPALGGSGTGVVCYGPTTAGSTRIWRQGGGVVGVDMSLPRILQVSGNEQIVLGLLSDGSVMQLDADHAVRYVDGGGGAVTQPTDTAGRQLMAAGSPPKRIDLPKVCWVRAPFAIGCDGSAWAMTYQEYRSPSGEFMGAGPITGTRAVSIPTPVWRTRANRRMTSADAEMTADAVFIGVNGRVYDLNGQPINLPLDGVSWDTPDRTPLSPGLAAVAGDNILTREEAQADVALSGDAQAGSRVEVKFGGYTGNATADAQRRWALRVPAATLPKANGEVTIEVTATNPVGTSAPTRRTIRVVLNEAAAPTIAAVSGDDTVTAAEAASTVTISGSAEAGTTITVTWGGRTKQAIAGSTGGWAVGYAPGEMPAAGTTQVTAQASNENGAGGQASRTVRVVPAAPGTPTISPVTGDDVITAEEAKAGVTISGSATAGSTVAVSWQGQAKSAVATGGQWSVAYGPGEVPAVGTTTTVTAVASNDGGRSDTASRTVRIEAPPVLAPSQPAIAAITGDDILNGAELESGIAVTGTARAGDTVTVSALGTAHQAQAGAGGDWRVAFSARELAAIGNAEAVTFTATANLGGLSSTPATRTAKIDRPQPALLSLDPVTPDNTLSLAEQETGFAVTGTGSAGGSIRLHWSDANGGALADDILGSVGRDGRWTISVSSAALGKVVSVTQARLTATQSTTVGVLSVSRDVTVVQRRTADPCCLVGSR